MGSWASLPAKPRPLSTAPRCFYPDASLLVALTARHSVKTAVSCGGGGVFTICTLSTSVQSRVLFRVKGMCMFMFLCIYTQNRKPGLPFS